MIVERRGIDIADRNGIVPEWRQECECRCAGEDVEGGVVDEFGRVWVAVFRIVGIASGGERAV